MINSQIGYIICESEYQMGPVELKPKLFNGKLVGMGCLQTADEKNRNGRFYAHEELFPQVTCPRTTELIRAGYLRSECGHPLSKDLQRQSTIDDTKTNARFLKLWIEGMDIMAEFCGTNSKWGEAFNKDLAEGCLPAWSLRALGSIEQTRRGAEVKNLRVITWDQVIYPSHPGAYTQKLVSEQRLLNESSSILMEEKNDTHGYGMILPITNEKVINFLQAESSNLKFVRECFDFAYSGINVNEAGTKVVLTTNDGDTMVVNMESYIHNELMNYAYDEMTKYKTQL